MAFKSQRRFQNTGFGLDRDRSRNDNLPAWKKQMFNSIRNKTKQHRQTLLQRLEQQRNQNKNLSPNSKKKNANNTIDSFKRSLIDHHLKEFKQSNNNNNNNGNNNNQFNQSMNNNSNNNGFGMNNNNMNTTFGGNGNGFKQNSVFNGTGFKFNGFGNNSMNNNQQNGNMQNMQNMQNGKVQSMKFQEDQDMETANLSPEQYKQIFAELSKFLEDTEISDIRSSFVEELEKDNEMDELEEIIAHEDQFNPNVVYCPLCCKNAMEIEYINNHQAVYGCLCGTKFQARDKSVSIPAKKEKNNNMNMNNMFKFGVQENKENNWCIESDLEHGQRMLRSLKANISNLMNYHCQEIKCDAQMNFAVIDESGYLQAWCNQCNCNEIVI